MTSKSFFYRRASGEDVVFPLTTFLVLVRDGYMRWDGRLTMKGVRMARRLGVEKPAVRV